MTARRILFISRPEFISPVHADLKRNDCQAVVVEDKPSALKVLESKKPDLVFTLPSLPGYRAQDFLEVAAGYDVPVVVFSEKGSSGEARQFMELGAEDYWLAPLTWEKIRAMLPREVPVRPAPSASSAPPPKDFSIIGKHPAVARVLALARQVAPSRATVLISGESGTGKEMFARYIHAHSGWENGPFVVL